MGGLWASSGTDVKEQSEMKTGQSQTSSKSEQEMAGIKMGVPVNSKYKTPTLREIHELAKCIQKFDNERVYDIIWNNPKILVSEVDTPILLHEGCRYNALHICAKCGNSEAAKIILQAVSSTKMMNLLYPTDEYINKCIRIDYLVDLYLNTPDAIIHETPLHFATKFGFPRVCEILIQHPKVQLDVLNVELETPTSVICRRVNDSDPTKDSRFAEINRMFLAVFIVPIWRESDGSNGYIGKPIQPKQLGPIACPATLLPDFYDINPHLFDVDKSAIPTGLNGRLMEVSGYVGPMTAKEANMFLNLMKKSARAAQSYYHLSQTISCTLPTKDMDCRLPCRDCAEKLPTMKIEGTIAQKHEGNDLPLDLDCSSKDRFDNLITSIERILLDDEGGSKPTQLFQSSMEVLKGAKMVSNFPKPNVISIREAAMRMEDPLTGLERVARIKAKEVGCEMKQKWSFLNTYIDVTTDEGLNVLEDHLTKLEQKKDSTCEGIIRDENGKVDICKTLMSMKISDEKPYDKKESKESANTSRKNSCPTSTNGFADIFEDCETKDVFIHGDFPTMDDWFLQKAVQDTLENIPDKERNEKYPHLSRWYDKLKSFGNASRKGWAAAKPVRRR
ncbi:unnamed protein product [Allacma fusca]|uniref:Uncharacterized protein n=1 Tax=Allacma fusca TaxID=39272 RepID=A0A8J2J6L4_9HEXA|nr:unnamed protein product [Allacma fusca]